MVSFDFFNLSDCFDIEANRRVHSGFLNVDPIFMDTFDDNFFKQAVSVWAKHHHLVKFDDSSRHHTSEDQTNTFRLIARVHNKLMLDLRVGIVDGLRYLLFLNFRHLRRRKNAHELSYNIDSFTRAARH